MKLSRILFLLLSSCLASFQVKAACTEIAELRTDKLYIEISDGGCGPLLISFATKIGKDGKPLDGTVKSFPFDDECKLSANKRGAPSVLACHADGRTPLAGASYKRKFGGYETRQYEGRKVKEKLPYYVYVCIKGCDRKGTPKKLYEPALT